MPGGSSDVIGAMAGAGAAAQQSVATTPDLKAELQRVTSQLQPLQSQLDQVLGTVKAIVTQFPIDSDVTGQFAEAIGAAKSALTQIVMTVIKQAPTGPERSLPVPMG